MIEYRDPITGYLVRRYTDGPERNAKLYFTTENPREVDGVLKALREHAPFDPGACTRGLYLRGVE